jgi:hypothetical protein
MPVDPPRPPVGPPAAPVEPAAPTAPPLPAAPEPFPLGELPQPAPNAQAATNEIENPRATLECMSITSACVDQDIRCTNARATSIRTG